MKWPTGGLPSREIETNFMRKKHINRIVSLSLWQSAATLEREESGGGHMKSEKAFKILFPT